MTPNAPAYLVKRVFALLGQAHITERTDRLRLFRWVLRDITIMSTDDLDQFDLEAIANTLTAWQKQGELELRARMAVGEQWAE